MPNAKNYKIGQKAAQQPTQNKAKLSLSANRKFLELAAYCEQIGLAGPDNKLSVAAMLVVGALKPKEPHQGSPGPRQPTTFAA